MTKIMFHCDWGQSSEQLLDHYRWLTPEGSGKWGDLEGTTNKAEADFHIVMDGGMPDDVDPQTVIYFQREEPQVKPTELSWGNIFYQATFTDMRHHNVAVWRVKKTYDELKERLERVLGTSGPVTGRAEEMDSPAQENVNSRFGSDSTPTEETTNDAPSEEEDAMSYFSKLAGEG